MHRSSEDFVRVLMQNFILTVLFFVMGKLSLFMAIPPGFATAIFPPTGIALAFLYAYGINCLPGIFFGSFFLNITSQISAGGDSSSATLYVIPIIIGLGCAAQAVFGYLFSRPFYNHQLPLVKVKEVIFFLLLAGPVSCLFNSIFATTVLYLNDQIDFKNVLFTWFNWWVGDTLGILLVFPILISYIGKEKSLWKQRRLAISAPLLVSVILCMIIFWNLSRSEYNRMEEDFGRIAMKMQSSIQSEFQKTINKVESIRNLFYASNNVDRSEFHEFVSHIIGDEGGLTSFQWAPLTKAHDVKKLREKISKETKRKIEFNEKDVFSNGEAFIVEYASPASVLNNTLGKNINTNEEILNAINYAIVLYSPTLLNVTHQNSHGDERELLLIIPVYNKKKHFENKDEILGIILGYINVNTFFRKALDNQNFSEIHFEFNFVKDNVNETIYTINNTQVPDYPNIIFHYPEKIYNRDYNISMSPKMTYFSRTETILSWAILIGGLSLSCLLGIFLLTFSGRGQEIQREVSKKTKELQIINAQLQEATLAKTIFLANMSHEIRTPMNAILGMADLLEDKLTNKKQKEDLQTIAKSAKDLLIIIDDILDFSKLESNKLTVQEQNFSLNQMIKEISAMFKPMAEHKNLDFSISKKGAIHDYMRGDPTRMKQILINLISNAIKFTNKGFVKIRISTSENGHATLVKFRVIDSGIGIKESEATKLFTPFEQLSTGANKLYKGTGLGLSISKGLASILGGNLTYEKGNEGGSMFTFEVPLEQVDEIEYEINKINTVRLNSELYSKKILIVEDNLINQKITERLLEKLGLESKTCNDGRMALDLIQKEYFDIILMDCQMPVLDGYEATKIIRESLKLEDIYIIALTANAMKEDKEKCLNAGMNDYIAKPIERNLLITALNKSLTRAKRT